MHFSVSLISIVFFWSHGVVFVFIKMIIKVYCEICIKMCGIKKVFFLFFFLFFDVKFVVRGEQRGQKRPPSAHSDKGVGVGSHVTRVITCLPPPVKHVPVETLEKMCEG